MIGGRPFTYNYCNYVPMHDGSTQSSFSRPTTQMLHFVASSAKNKPERTYSEPVPHGITKKPRFILQNMYLHVCAWNGLSVHFQDLARGSHSTDSYPGYNCQINSILHSLCSSDDLPIESLELTVGCGAFTTQTFSVIMTLFLFARFTAPPSIIAPLEQCFGRIIQCSETASSSESRHARSPCGPRRHARVKSSAL